MGITSADWKQRFLNVSDAWASNAEALSAIDAAIGDGDHGVTIKRIAVLMRKTIEEDMRDAGAMLSDLGDAIVNIQGGSAGPLWGTYITGMGDAINDNENASVHDILVAGLESLRDVSTAKVGDKTMMDAIIPATEAAVGLDGQEALEAAAKAARQGSDNTANMVAKFGRAKNYKEQSLGYRDAGSCSAALFFEALAKQN